MTRIEVLPYDDFVARAVSFIAAAGRPVALSGGSTPRPVYEGLTDAEGDWWQVDERHVPLGHPASNAGMIEKTGLRLRRIDTSLAPEDAAAEYGRACREVAPFALMVLGLGDDGHTASLFPGAPELAEDHHWCVATAAAHAGHRRITMTLPCINAAEERVFLVSGQAKASIVKRVVAEADPALPASLVNDPLWLLDAEAASHL